MVTTQAVSLVTVCLAAGLLAPMVGQINVAAAQSSVPGPRVADLLRPPPSPGSPHSPLVPGSPWQALPTPPFVPGSMFVLTDGTVLVQDNGPSNVGTGEWWRSLPTTRAATSMAPGPSSLPCRRDMHRQTTPQPCSRTDGSSSRVVSTTPAARSGPTRVPSTTHDQHVEVGRTPDRK